MDNIKVKNSLSDRIAMVVILLMAIGTSFVFSAGVNVTHSMELEKFYSFPQIRQILFFPLACLVMFSIARLDYHILTLRRKWYKSPILYLLIVSIILCAIVLIPAIGTEVNYARRWLQIDAGAFTVSFQPSEMAKWVIISFVAAYCAYFGSSIRDFRKRFVPLCCAVGLPVLMVVKEDLGTAAFISLLTFLLLVIAGARWWHILMPLPFGLAAFLTVLINSPARMTRIAAFMNPEKWADSAAYQANQSLIALGSGGVLGKGLGRGICKYGHLPEDTTDFIFSIIGEELGLIGTATVIILFLLFLWLGLMVVIRCRDRFGQLLAVGIVLAIAIQAALNIGVVTVVLPTKGIPLPFVSSGGTSMLFSAAAVGVLLNIASQSPKRDQNTEEENSCEI